MDVYRTAYLGIVACLMLGLTGSAVAEESRVYALQFRDGHTEGSWVWALDNGRLYEIDFAKNSNPKAIETLAALHPEIIRLNTSPENNIYLIGEILKPDKAIRKSGHMEKAVLRMDGWYIKAPFYLPPQMDPDGKLRVSSVLTPADFLPAGERPDSEATRKLRASIIINHDKRLSLFWFGVPSPLNKCLEKGRER